MKVTVNYTYQSNADGRGISGTGYSWKAWSLLPDKSDCLMAYGQSKTAARDALVLQLKTKLETKDPTPEEVDI
jgi:hypothetical protein